MKKLFGKRLDKAFFLCYTNYRKNEREETKMSKKKTITVGTIKGIDLIKATKPIQEISFRTGYYTDKRKKRKKITVRNMDKWM